MPAATAAGAACAVLAAVLAAALAAGLAGKRAGSLGHVAAVADAAPATENAPAAMSAMALDRPDGTVRCRDKGTLLWFACHAICFTPDRNRHVWVAGICSRDVARVRAPGSLEGCHPTAGCCRVSTLPDANAISDRMAV
jgi:hypothetical protein